MCFNLDVQFLTKEKIMSLFNQTNITNFVLEIPDAGITRAFKLNVATCLLPGLRIPTTDVPLGPQGLARAKLPGSTVEFDPLVVRFLVDSNFNSWIDIYSWMLSLNNYKTLKSNGWQDGVLPKFVTLHILNNTKTETVMSVHYHGAWPSSLSEIDFSFTEEGDPAVTCVASFDYKYFEIEKNGIIIKSREAITDRQSNNVSSASMHPSLR